MAYATTDPLICLTPASIAVGPRLWYHESADALAAVNTDGFITDGVAKGLKAGDYVLHRDITSNVTSSSLHHVVSIDTDAGDVDLSDGTVVVDGTDSD
jgi:hypothetical protein